MPLGLKSLGNKIQKSYYEKVLTKFVDDDKIDDEFKVEYARFKEVIADIEKIQDSVEKSKNILHRFYYEQSRLAEVAAHFYSHLPDKEMNKAAIEVQVIAEKLSQEAAIMSDYVSSTTAPQIKQIKDTLVEFKARKTEWSKWRVKAQRANEKGDPQYEEYKKKFEEIDAALRSGLINIHENRVSLIHSTYLQMLEQQNLFLSHIVANASSFKSNVDSLKDNGESNNLPSSFEEVLNRFSDLTTKTRGEMEDDKSSMGSVSPVGRDMSTSSPTGAVPLSRKPKGRVVICSYEFEGNAAEDTLTIAPGDKIEIDDTISEQGSDWVYGTIIEGSNVGAHGFFPASFASE